MAAGKQCGLRSWAVVAFMVLCGIAHLQAATIYVSTAGNDANDGLTWATAKLNVQTGLNAAAERDQVWVAEGTYVGCITLKAGVGLYGGFAGSEDTATFDLADRDFEANETILDGNQAGSVVTAPQNATASTRIDGFTIRNGTGTLLGSNRCGGGICCRSSSPTIENNTITGNSSSNYGGGIYCRSSSPTIANNTITGNSASNGGSGIYCGSSSPTIANNTITGNSSSNYGGGIYCDSSSPTIANNTITGNSGGEAGGIYCYQYSSPTIANNTITGNSGSYGGGIYCCIISFPTIANNTITGNSGGEAGGIYCEYSSPTIANNTITGNSGTVGGGIWCRNSSPTIANTIIAFNSHGIYHYFGGTPTLRYNCVYGNTAYNYSGITDPTGTDGNISADPRFVQIDPGTDGIWGTADDDYSDLRLLADSPCIDAANNADVPANFADLDGDGDTVEPLPFDLAGAARFADDLYVFDTGSGTAPIVDMGAYEYLCGDIDGDGHVNIFDIFCIAECWNTQAGDPAFDPRCDFDGDGFITVFDIFVIAENWNR